MEIRDLVVRPPVTCGGGVSLRDVAALMQSEEVGSVVVLRGGVLDGIVTDRDLVRATAAGANPMTQVVWRWMTPDPDTIDADMDVAEAADWLVASGYRHIPVVDGSRLAGVTSIKDILWAMTETPLSS
jgi:CBS domain-containing protein